MKVNKFVLFLFLFFLVILAYVIKNTASIFFDSDTYKKIELLEKTLVDLENQKDKDDESFRKYQEFRRDFHILHKDISLLDLVLIKNIKMMNENYNQFRDWIFGELSYLEFLIKQRSSLIRSLFDNSAQTTKRKDKINKEYIHNFANIYGGASVLEKHQDLQNADNVITDGKDNYMITDCKNSDHFIVISLKEEIEFTSMMLVNKELFSSTVKNFQVYGSQIFPTDQWNFLGNFTAQNNNEMQFFQIQRHPVRYVKIRFQNYYQDEYFCIITQIKIFGKTTTADLIESHHFQKQIINITIQSEEEQENFDQGVPNQQFLSIDGPKEDENIDEQHIEYPITEQEDEFIPEGSKINFSQYCVLEETCDQLDFFYSQIVETIEVKQQQQENNGRTSNTFKPILPYHNNQSVFKVTSQNMMILQDNQELLKKKLLETIQIISKRINNTKDYINDLDKKSLDMLQKMQNMKLEQYRMNSKIVGMEKIQQIQQILIFCLLGFAAILIVLLFCFLRKPDSHAESPTFKIEEVKQQQSAKLIQKDRLVQSQIDLNEKQKTHEGPTKSKTPKNKLSNNIK